MNQEELQKDWDWWLVRCFYEAGYINMGLIVKEFQTRHGYEGNDKLAKPFVDLLRYPKYPFQYKTSVSRFICAYLPTIADALWKHDKSRIDDIAKAVNKLKSTTRNEPADLQKYRAEASERAKTRKKMKVAMIEKGAVANHYDKHLRSAQWGVVK